MGTSRQAQAEVERSQPVELGVERSRDALERARRLVAVISIESLDGLQELCGQMGRHLLEEFPAFGTDAELEAEMHGAVEANLWHVFERVMPGKAGALTAPDDALRFAASVLHRGIDTTELVQAYRVGQNMAWSWWMQRLAARIEERDVLIEAMDLSSLRMFAYVDRVVDDQVQLWEQERRRWLGRAVALRTEMAQRLLRGEAPGLEEVARALECEINRPLVAAILWEHDAGVGGEPAMSRLEQLAEAMARAIGLDGALLVPAGAASVWAWFAAAQAPSLGALAQAAGDVREERQGVALGLVGRGVEGFRASHRQARRAQRLAELAGGEPGVIRFDEVETLCMLGEDADQIAEFVRRKLGGLADPDPAAERSRETLLAWLQEGGNATRAAARVRTHKNSIKYRVQRAEAQLGPGAREDPLGLELALRLVERIGVGWLPG